MRQCLLIAPDGFALLFDKVKQVGILNGLDRPGGTIYGSGRDKEYIYFPFHKFAFPFTSVIGEPLVFVHANITSAGLFVNPDLWMSLELEAARLLPLGNLQPFAPPNSFYAILSYLPILQDIARGNF